MRMNCKKSIMYGIALWVIIFVEVSILGFIPQLARVGEHGFEFNSLGQWMFITVTAVTAFFVGTHYFHKEKKRELVDGIVAFLPVLLTGLVLDIAITVPFFVKDYAAFLYDQMLWLSILFSWGTFAVSAPVRLGMKSKKRKN